MKLKKIDESKFECLLLQEDLEDNDISLGDFFKNDTEKIHNLLDVIMDEARKNIGISMEGRMISMQLHPMPNNAVKLIVSSALEDNKDFLKSIEDGIASVKREQKERKEKSNVIKNGTDYEPHGFKDFTNQSEDLAKHMDAAESENESYEAFRGSNLIKAECVCFAFDSLSDIEDMCRCMPRTYGINNKIYKYTDADKNIRFYLCIEKSRCSEEKYKNIMLFLMEYGQYDSSEKSRIAFLDEHSELLIKSNAINNIKKYI